MSTMRDQQLARRVRVGRSRDGRANVAELRQELRSLRRLVETLEVQVLAQRQRIARLEGVRCVCCSDGAS